MLKLDHFVVHIDNREGILIDLQRRIEPLGFPFDPKRGKGTRGFKIANIFVGAQYFEIVRLLSQEGEGWPGRWVKRYNDGARGIFCLFLATDDIDAQSRRLKDLGVGIRGPERIRFTLFCGLVQKSASWQVAYTPPLPGTDFELGLIQYDVGIQAKIGHTRPNAAENGITGISAAAVDAPLGKDAIRLLLRLFPSARQESDGIHVDLDAGSLSFRDANSVKVRLTADSTERYRGGRFSLYNVTVDS